MKKLFSLLTVLLCAVMLSTTVFAAKVDPLAIYQKYLASSSDTKSMDMTVRQKISMVDGEELIDVLRQDIAVKMLITADDKLQMEMRTIDLSTLETSYAYFRNDYLYQQVGDQKFKIKMDMDEALAAAANVDIELTEDMLKDAKVELLSDGVKITYKTNLSNEQGDNPMASMLDSMELPEGMKMSFTSITSSVTLGFDGVMKSGTTAFGMKVSSGDLSFDFKIAQSYAVNSVNSINAIHFPADLASYQALEA